MVFIFLRIETEYGFWKKEERIVGRKDIVNQYEETEAGYKKLLLEHNPKRFFSKVRAQVPYSSLIKHAHVTGQTGKGKSEFLRLLFYALQDYSQKKKKYSLVLIDPHGDLAKKIKNSNLNTEHKRLIYFAPTLEKGYSPVINPLQLEDKSLIEKTTEFIVEAFDELMRDQTLSDQMRTILTPCVYTLLNKGNSDLLELQKFMMNDPSLIELGKRSPIKPHRDFFKYNFLGEKGRDPYARTKNAIYVRIQNLLNSPKFYNMTKGKSTVNLRKALNGGKVVLFDLSGLGGITKEAFGRFLMAKIKAIASDRERIPEERRKPTFVFIDECQNFITSSIEKTLSEMRKYGLHLILAHQYVEQLHELTYAVLANTDMKVVFENHESTLNRFSSYMGMSVKEMREGWKKYECYVKVGGRKTMKFKPSSKLIRKDKYKLTEEQEKELDRYMLDKYYRKDDQYEIKLEESQEDTKDENFDSLSAFPQDDDF